MIFPELLMMVMVSVVIAILACNHGENTAAVESAGLNGGFKSYERNSAFRPGTSTNPAGPSMPQETNGSTAQPATTGGA